MGLCKNCIHTEVCCRDKNIVGDIYVAPSPWYFDEEYRKKAWENYLEREKQGFPCDEFLEVVRCKDCKRAEFAEAGMTYCPEIIGSWVEDDWFCADGERREDGKAD